jgi:hypothetical protein
MLVTDCAYEEDEYLELDLVLIWGVWGKALRVAQLGHGEKNVII